MSPQSERQPVAGAESTQIDRVNPLAGSMYLKCVRVYDVGQGDGIAILDDKDQSVLQVDYGGRQSNPFTGWPPNKIDAYMPAPNSELIMLTHWDEDHWCTAAKGKSVRGAAWLVPRQVTSPRAVRFSASLNRISCIPEARVGEAFCFRTIGGDEIWWEKIAASEVDGTKHEDCNKTGVALSVVKRAEPGAGQVILIPGDAPFHRVRHYDRHRAENLSLRGLVAFHHGAKTHWTEATRTLLKTWPIGRRKTEVVFSYGDPNSFHHPFEQSYTAQLGRTAKFLRTPLCRGGRKQQFIDISF
jgi:hypothetical protein